MFSYHTIIVFAMKKLTCIVSQFEESKRHDLFHKEISCQKKKLLGKKKQCYVCKMKVGNN
jgi:hypothetical protein